MMASERNSMSFFKRIVIWIVSIILVLCQIAFYVFIVVSNIAETQTVYLASTIVGIICVVIIHHSTANSSYKLSWTIFILILPLAGTLIFLLFGNGRSLRKRKTKPIDRYISSKVKCGKTIYEELMEKDLIASKHARLLEKLSNIGIYKNTSAKYFDDVANKHDFLLQDLRKAKKSIFLEYFLIAEGSMWGEIKTILIQKAHEGVEIKIIYDDIGSKTVMPKKSMKKLNDIPNISVKVYNPMGTNISFGLNYRDHRKMTIIDGSIAYIGGDNLADEYVHRKKRFGYWRDNAMRIEGEAVYGYLLLFTQMWFLCSKEILDIDKYEGKYLPLERKSIHIPFGDGPLNKNNPAYSLITSVISNAQKYLYLSTPYFIIDQYFIDELRQIAQSGVDVRVLVPKIPDKKLVFRMTKSHYGSLLQAGGRVYEYTPGFNHAKNIICDDKYGLMGTINIDYRSLFLHFECGDLILFDEEIIKMKNDFLKSVEISDEITLKRWEKRSIWQKFLEFILDIISPLM